MTSVDDETEITGLAPASFALGNGHHPSSAEPPPQSDSPLGSLRARRAKQQEHLYHDLLVPGWHEDPDDPEPISIYVRCRPSRPSEMARAMEQRRKQAKKHRNWAELAHADALVEACVGVFALQGQPAADIDTDDRSKLSLRDGDAYGEWTKFDKDLAHSLGLVEERVTAVRVVLALFPTEANVVSAMNELTRWSGVERPRDAEDFFAD